jgi:hypothetical protein
MSEDTDDIVKRMMSGCNMEAIDQAVDRRRVLCERTEKKVMDVRVQGKTVCHDEIVGPAYRTHKKEMMPKHTVEYDPRKHQIVAHIRPEYKVTDQDSISTTPKGKYAKQEPTRQQDSITYSQTQIQPQPITRVVSEKESQVIIASSDKNHPINNDGKSNKQWMTHACIHERTAGYKPREDHYDCTPQQVGVDQSKRVNNEANIQEYLNDHCIAVPVASNTISACSSCLPKRSQNDFILIQHRDYVQTKTCSQISKGVEIQYKNHGQHVYKEEYSDEMYSLPMQKVQFIERTTQPNTRREETTDYKLRHQESYQNSKDNEVEYEVKVQDTCQQDKLDSEIRIKDLTEPASGIKTKAFEINDHISATKPLERANSDFNNFIDENQILFKTNTSQTPQESPKCSAQPSGAKSSFPPSSTSHHKSKGIVPIRVPHSSNPRVDADSALRRLFQSGLSGEVITNSQLFERVWADRENQRMEEVAAWLSQRKAESSSSEKGDSDAHKESEGVSHGKGDEFGVTQVVIHEFKFGERESTPAEDYAGFHNDPVERIFQVPSNQSKQIYPQDLAVASCSSIRETHVVKEEDITFQEVVRLCHTTQNCGQISMKKNGETMCEGIQPNLIDQQEDKELSKVSFSESEETSHLNSEQNAKKIDEYMNRLTEVFKTQRTPPVELKSISRSEFAQTVDKQRTLKSSSVSSNMNMNFKEEPIENYSNMSKGPKLDRYTHQPSEDEELDLRTSDIDLAINQHQNMNSARGEERRSAPISKGLHPTPQVNPYMLTSSAANKLSSSNLHADHREPHFQTPVSPQRDQSSQSSESSQPKSVLTGSVYLSPCPSFMAGLSPQK